MAYLRIERMGSARAIFHDECGRMIGSAEYKSKQRMWNLCLYGTFKFKHSYDFNQRKLDGCLRMAQIYLIELAFYRYKDHKIMAYIWDNIE